MRKNKILKQLLVIFLILSPFFLIAQEYSDDGQISFAAWTLSVAYSFKGDLTRAVEYGELAVQKAPPGGDKAWAQRYLGWGLCRAGDLNRGIELLTAGLSLSKAGHWMPGVIPTICALGEAYWLSGDHDKAKRTLEEGLEILERCKAKYYIGFAQRLLGEISLKNNLAQAALHFEKSVAIFQEIKAENELALAYAGYARYYKQQNQITRTREYLTKALEIFKRLGTLIEPEKVREVLAELPEA